MKIKIHSSELNRMMKVITQCIDQRFSNYSNIEIIYDNNLLTIRGTNGTIQATMYTPLLGGNGEVFCVDGTMFARVCAMCNGEIEISTDGKTCTIKGAGRTRLPIVNGNVPSQASVGGSSMHISAGTLAKCFSGVSYAISSDQNRVQLTGVLTEVNRFGLRLVALDGFQMSIENAQCDGDEMKVIIPGTMMKLIVQGALADEDLTLRTDGKRVEAVTDGMKLVSGLLTGDFPDYNRILPTGFKTECIVNTEAFRNALKSGSVINTKQNLIKLDVGADCVKVMSNSEDADYDADVPCDTHGDGLKIAFNLKYLMGTMSTIDTDETILKFNSSISPVIIQPKVDDGINAGFRLLLPVRTQG